MSAFLPTTGLRKIKKLPAKKLGGGVVKEEGVLLKGFHGDNSFVERTVGPPVQDCQAKFCRAGKKVSPPAPHTPAATGIPHHPAHSTPKTADRQPNEQTDEQTGRQADEQTGALPRTPPGEHTSPGPPDQGTPPTIAGHSFYAAAPCFRIRRLQSQAAGMRPGFRIRKRLPAPSTCLQSYVYFLYKSPGVASHTSCRFVQIPRLFRSVLAGRLEADNVAGALRLCRPDGVDFNSRLESAPGRKDPLRVTAAVQAVRQACGGEAPAGTVCGTVRQANPHGNLPAAAAAGCGTVRQACGKGRHQ